MQFLLQVWHIAIIICNVIVTVIQREMSLQDIKPPPPEKPGNALFLAWLRVGIRHGHYIHTEGILKYFSLLEVQNGWIVLE